MPFAFWGTAPQTLRNITFDQPVVSASRVPKPSPVQVIGGHLFASVSAGVYHTCGATTSGSAFCWGWNGPGVLGDGTFVNRSSPVFVMNLDPAIP